MLGPAARRPQRSGLLGAAALSGLVAVLAVLQYRWLGQVAEADVLRLRSGARSRAEDLARELDREITLAFLWLRADADTHDFTERWARWSRLAAHPQVVRAVGLVRDGTFRRFSPATGTFEPAEWPPSLRAVRARLTATPPWPPLGSAPDERGPTGPLDPDLPALITPVLEFRLGRPVGPEPWSPLRAPASTVVILDGEYLRRELVPELVRRHFAPGGDSDYRLRIDRRENPSEVVFTSDPALPPNGQADVRVGLFAIRPDELGESDRAGLPWPARLPAGTRRAPLGPGGGLPPFLAGEREPGHWRLLVRHRAGSVEAVVGAVRRRNLAVSGGVLALLLASAGLLMVSAQRARRLADRQIEFVAGVSHELRTPLAAICVAGDNLAAGLVADRVTARQYGGVIRDEGRRLADMVESVLDLAGTYSGQRKWRFEPVAVGPLLRESSAVVEPTAGKRGLRIDSRVDGELPFVRAERAALGRAVVNLLQNAVLHGGDGGFVCLRADVAFEEGERTVRISVEDRGRGIPASEVPHLFDTFFRGRDAVASQTPGSGLGLSLVKRIVDAHGGRVDVATAPGRGSVFTIVLPALVGKDP
jgi:signal transduction histidine kinase